MVGVLPSGRSPLSPGRKKARLSPELLAETASLAEELVEERFRLGSRWRALQYEVLTKSPWLPEESLAALMRAETDHPLPHRRRDFYLILLQEERLLKMAQGDYLRALLLYIFTHELIHMVRFVRFAASFWMRPEERAYEEALVHELSSAVLQRLKWPGLQEILRLFDLVYQGPHGPKEKF